MYLKYVFFKTFSIIFLVTLLGGLKASDVQAVEIEAMEVEETASCLFCHKQSNRVILPFTSEKQLLEYIHAENLPIPAGTSCDMAGGPQEHMAKKQKVSDIIGVNKYQTEMDVRSLIPVALDHYYERTKQDNLEKVERWQRIVKDYPNVKREICAFYQDYRALNRIHLSRICCLKSTMALLNSMGAYCIMEALEAHGWWGSETTFPDSFGALSWLTSLNLYEWEDSDYPIVKENHIPSVIMRLTNLVNLCICENNINEFPQDIEALKKLQRLEVQNNPMKKLEGIGKLTSLTELEIRGSAFSTFPSEIGNLTALKELIIADSCLTTLPNEIGKLTNLVTLKLYQSSRYQQANWFGVRRLPTGIANLENLHHLVWNVYNLSFLPTSFGKFLTMREHNAIEPSEIRCDKFCGWEDDNRNSFKLCRDNLRCLGGVIKLARDCLAYCGLPRTTYKIMLSDCYHRYHDHLFVRCLLNEIEHFLEISIPREIMSSIAGFMYEIEEQDLIKKMEVNEKLKESMQSKKLPFEVS